MLSGRSNLANDRTIESVPRRNSTVLRNVCVASCLPLTQADVNGEWSGWTWRRPDERRRSQIQTLYAAFIKLRALWWTVAYIVDMNMKRPINITSRSVVERVTVIKKIGCQKIKKVRWLFWAKISILKNVHVTTVRGQNDARTWPNHRHIYIKVSTSMGYTRTGIGILLILP